MSYNKNNAKQTKKDALEDYVPVHARVAAFYKKFPEGRIITDIVIIDEEKVIMKATIYRDERDIIAAQDFALEKFGSSFINVNSALENCSTSATGRALAMLGFEIKKSIASYEEVANAKLNQENKEVNHKFENKVVTPANKNLLLSAASKKGYTKEVFEGMLEKKYHCNLSNIDMNTFNTVYSNLSKVKCAVAESN